MKNMTYVEVQVGNRLKKYIEENFNRRGELKDGMVCPKKGSTLLDIIRPYLELQSYIEKQEKQDLPPDETIRIAFPLMRGQKVYNRSSGKVYYCDTFWRNWLNPAGHKKLERLFENNFRFYLFAHLDGYASGQREKDPQCRPKMKHGLYEFCDNFNINPDTKEVKTLLRAYYRYVEDREHSNVSPFFF